MEHKTWCKYCEKSVARYRKHKKGQKHLLKRRNTSAIPKVAVPLVQSQSSRSDYIWDFKSKIDNTAAPKIEVTTIIDQQIYSVRLEARDPLHSKFEFKCLESTWQFSVVEIDEEFYFDLSTDATHIVHVKVELSTQSATITSTRQLNLSPNTPERWTDFNTLGDSAFTLVNIVIRKISPEPHPATAERIKCPAEARLIMKWAHDHNITEKALTGLFSMLDLPTFNIDNRPHSVYGMKKMARVATPDMQLHSSVDRNGVRFYYYKPDDILRVMLASSTITEGWCSVYTEEHSIKHQANSILWKDIQHELQPLIDDGCLLLLPQFFYDDFNLSRFSSIVTDDLLMNIANCSVTVQLDREYKYLCCSMQANKWDIVSTVLMPFQSLLERGEFETYFAPAGQVKRFCGSILNFIGDYMGHTEMIGLMGPKAGFPSRLTERTQEELSDEGPLVYRDSNQTFKYLNEIMTIGDKRGHKIRNQEKLRSKGFRDCFEMSPLWHSELLRYKFFQRFAPCILHSEILGNLLRHLNFVGQHLGKEKIKELNERILSIKKWPGTTNIQGVYEVVTSKKTGQEKIKVKWSTGPKLNSFYQVATSVLRGLLDDEHLALLAQHIQLTQHLHRKEWSDKEIDDLQLAIESLKDSLKEYWPEPTYKWKTVKFEALSAWPSFIRLIAPPYLLSTQTWEVVHQEGRRIYNLTNKQLTARDYLKKSIERKLIKHHQNELDSDACLHSFEAQLAPAKREHENYRPIGKIRVQLPSVLLSKCKGLLQQLRTSAKLVPINTWTATGYYFNGSIYRIDDSISFNSPLCERLTIGTITNIYVVKTKDSRQSLWVQIRVYDANKKADASGNYPLKESHTVMIPFGQFAFEMERREHIVPDFVAKGQFLLNTFSTGN